MNSEEYVILVDEQDKDLGLMEKMEAHRKGVLHRAVSVFVFNDKQEMLLQQRALSKYHSGGLWTNAACSHPRKNELCKAAAERRLKEEMGIEIKLEEKFSFIYRAELDNALTEHELDYVFNGIFNGVPEFNTEEVCAYRWISKEQLLSELEERPQQFTAWFRIIMKDQGVNLYPTPRME